MSSEQAHLFEELIDRLMYLGSVEQVRRAAGSIRGLDPADLRNAIDERLAELKQEGREDEAELLQFVRDALQDVLRATGTPVQTQVDTFEDLRRAAVAATSLPMRTLLRQHRELLTHENLAELSVSVTEPDLQPGIRYRRVVLAYVAARVAGNREDRVTACLMAGGFWRQQNQLRRAQRLLDRALRLTDDENPSSKMTILAAQAGLCRAAGDLGKAVEILKQCLELAIAADDPVVIVGTRTGLAQCFRRLGEYSQALDELNVVVSLLEQTRLSQLPQALLDRGLVLENLGRFEQGARDYDQAARLSEQCEDRNTAFVAMNNFAASHLKRGRAREGYDEYRKILREVERWGNPVMVASTHNNLGTTLLQMDRPAEALAEFGKALASKINTGHREGEAIAFFGMGDAYLSLGELEKASTWYTMALMPAIESGDANLMVMWALSVTDQRLRAAEKDPIGTLESARKQARAANLRFQELLTVRRLIQCYSERGNDSEVMRLYQEIFGQGTLDPRAPEQLPLIIDYARLLARQPESAKAAFQTLDHAREMIDNEIKDLLINTHRAEAIGHSIELYGALIGLLTKGNAARDAGIKNPHILAFDLHEAAKARTMLSTLADSPLEPPASVPQELRDRESDLLQAERDFQEREWKGSETYREQRLREIHRDLEECWTSMRESAPDYVRFRSGEPCSFEEIRAAMAREAGTDTAWVSFFCEPSGTSVFLVRPDSAEPLVFHLPVGAKEWREVARQLRRAFNGASLEFPPYPPILRDRPAQRSLEFLDSASAGFADFLAAVQDMKCLCVAPHGPLHLIPLHALRMPDGDYIARRFGVVYCPSLSVGVRMLSEPTDGRANPSVFVAGTSAADDPHPEYFERDQAIFNPKDWTVTTGFGLEGSSRRNLLAELPRHDLIHLSCHGYFDNLNALDSGLLVSDAHNKPPRDLRSLSVMERPRFLITVRDLLRVRLHSQLVTFNACSGGLQTERNAGDELDGFSRSLLLAGASSVLLGLWNVDQQSSSDFLGRFYRYWQADRQPGAKLRALHQAQLDYLDAPEPYLRHPYHWAPFILSGNWR